MTDHIHIFIDDNKGYLAWLDNNQIGYVVNCSQTPKPDYLILHHGNCRTIRHATRGKGNWTNSDYIKVCSLDKTKLSIWAKRAIGGQLQPCQKCKP